MTYDIFNGACFFANYFLSFNCRIFVNRSLHLDKIKFFGFDMDYTLAGKQISHFISYFMDFLHITRQIVKNWEYRLCMYTYLRQRKYNSNSYDYTIQWCLVTNLKK